MNKNEPLPIDNTGTGKLGSIRVQDKPEMTYCGGCVAETEMYRPIGQHWWARYDVYGIYTGIYCDECYASGDSDKYPYRKDSYAKDLEHGEHIYPEEERY